ncbi:MAG TPA: SMC-Scp complex subunit ScpB [Thermomicrobiales bacterium]|nr:SMC-Scp complex subunit ScpB [Thermomicrobiales bacterium]
MTETIANPTPDQIDDLPGTQLPIPGTESLHSITIPELAALMEAFLLVATEQPTIDDLAKGAGVEPDQIELALARINEDEGRGWVVQKHGRKVQLATAPRFADRVRTFLGLDRESRLSSAAIETLAIVAYQQPVTRAEIDAVRGFDSSGVLATLHSRGLIEPVSRLQTVGNPIQYGTTAEFLQHFGLRSLSELPPLGQIEGRDARDALDAAAQAGRPDDMEPLASSDALTGEDA